MKKVRIILSAIAVLAVVGGALAFKARTFHIHVIWTVRNGFDRCTVSLTGFTLTNDSNTLTYATDVQNGFCTTQTYIEEDIDDL